MWFHYINEKDMNRRNKSMVHGRVFWHFKKDNNEIYAEWVLGSKVFDLGFTVSKSYVSEHTMSFVFAIPPVALYWGFTWKWLEDRNWWKKLVKEDESKIMGSFSGKTYTKHAERLVFSFRIFAWTIWGDFYKNENESKSSDPWWMDWSFNIPDFFLGKSKYTTETLEERDVKIPMPEKEYDAKVKIFKSTWKRSRWFIPREAVRASVEMEEPIPHPGKGTCGYNCGEDALYGGTFCVTNVADAICEVIKSVTKYRLTYPL